jgi:hypothetical protein
MTSLSTLLFDWHVLIVQRGHVYTLFNVYQVFGHIRPLYYSFLTCPPSLNNF